MNSPHEFFDWFRMEWESFHKGWKEAQEKPGYYRQIWFHREQAFLNHAKKLADDLGIEPPYLRNIDR